MDWLDAVILGLVQGFTEFLPISSSGHLVLVRDLLSLPTTDALAFDAMLHFATTAAITIYFWSDIWTLIQAALRKLGRLPVNQKDITILYALIIGTIPAAVLGIFLESVVTEHLQKPVIVAGVLFCTAIFFMYTEWRYYLMPAHGELTLKKGILIGVYQALALIPGMSRSGSTIAGGMLLGLSRYESARFSFLLAIPITLGVGIKKCLDLIQEGGSVDWFMIGIGVSVAFFMALLVIHFFLGFIKRYTLWPFVWYSIILSGMVGYVTMFA